SHLLRTAPSTSGPHPVPILLPSDFDPSYLLAKIATRLNPTIPLGSVDMSCSFVVVDVRQYDSPIVYASPQFCLLTGYTCDEVIGHNCRFLQSQDGADPSYRSDSDGIIHLRRHLEQNLECQACVPNYKKGGESFINLITIIPVPAFDEMIDYHVGFQVDLTAHPNAIMHSLPGGNSVVNYSTTIKIPEAKVGYLVTRKWRRNYSMKTRISNDLHKLLESPAFVSASTLDISDNCQNEENNHPLSLLLLHALPDFILVLSLSGEFTYVAPAVKRVLGYSPGEFEHRYISQYCHPADVVPLMRELKESQRPPGPRDLTSGNSDAPKSINLLFRIRAKKNTRYSWIECRGRTLVATSKSRKALILSAR
ncbi:hypothetical protein BV25DRAFT_1763066, partial [Artomyces pyxidatus]